MFNFFKSKKKPELIYKKYNVGQTIVTILDMDNHEHISTFEGYVYQDINMISSFNIIIYNKIISANEYFNWYMNKNFSKNRLWELDDGNFIPENRIKLIKPAEETELWKEYVVPFGSDEYRQELINRK